MKGIHVCVLQPHLGRLGITGASAAISAAYSRLTAAEQRAYTSAAAMDKQLHEEYRQR